LYVIKNQNKKYRQLLRESEGRYKKLLVEYEDKLKTKIKDEKQRQLREAASMTHHLSNVISGMNHELSPWIGGIKNKITRLANKNKSGVISIGFVCTKMNDIMKACDSMCMLLDNLSRDVKKVQKYDIFISNIQETITSWVRLTITDRSIKENLSEENFTIDNQSLDFNCKHSPLLVSQVILNLVKNSIEHNPTMLDTLKIRVSGDEEMRALIYEDNGKGIPDDKLETIFTPGITTKHEDKELHGLGLSLCQDYCESMSAVITAESKHNGARFVIYFETDKTQAYENTKIRRIKKERETTERVSCRLGCK
jgi:signal transduction histidine kinase